MGMSVACIIYDGEKVFIAKRNPTGDMGGRWEFPGGKVDEGESDQTAIVREMSEEFGVKAFPGQFITEASFEHRGKKHFLHAYKVALEHDGMKNPFVLTEHTEYKWVLPEEIKNLEFVDSDLLIYPEVMRFIKGLN